MSTEVHPRLGARRRRVAEQQAHRRLRWVLVLMMIAAATAGGWWVSQSPLMAVDTIRIAGMDRDAALHLAGTAGLSDGVPILWVRPSRIEAALRADPWVDDARVSVDYPHTVSISVLLRHSVASVRTGDGWLAVTADGVVVAHEDGPGGRPTVVGGAPDVLRRGATLTEPEVQAGLAFAASLPADLAAGASVDVSAGIVADVAGHRVRLGRPERMEEKAGAVAALIAAGLPAGAEIDVSAPDRPAVSPPHLDSGSTVGDRSGSRDS